MPTLLALIGGNEFRENCREMDRALLARLGTSARVLVIPTAAAHESPRQAANNGVAHLKRLGAKAEPLYVTQREHAQADSMVAAIKEAKGVYFTGGDPVHLLETLRGTKVWKAVVELGERGGRLRGIAIVAGSSAGAMAFGGQTWVPGEGWREGLGLVPGVAVIPHHATVAARWNAAKMLESLAPGVTLVGIDVATALLLPDHLVLGEGEVTVYTPEAKAYKSGQVVVEKLG
jgi:cyanophycinase